MMVERESNKRPVVIITGLSGAGKSSALRSLEDIGFYCVDNIPVRLLEEFLELVASTKEDIKGVAVGVDVRDVENIEVLPEVVDKLRDKYNMKIYFLEASDETLINRFKETRRKHPLDRGNLLEAISEERKLLFDIRTIADEVVDTTRLTPHELRRLFVSIFGPSDKKMHVNVISFGFKKGIPVALDLLFDVRFLPNPYFVDELKNVDGTDSRVRDYVLSGTEAKRFMEKLLDFLDFLMPMYLNEGKSYLNIGFGCTGGFHRSVVIAQEVAKFIAGKGYKVDLFHRELNMVICSYEGLDDEKASG